MNERDRRWLEAILSLIARLEKRGVVDGAAAAELRSQAITAASSPLPQGGA
jgi:hypothetical protein